jgi:hypothetical protein
MVESLGPPHPIPNGYIIKLEVHKSTSLALPPSVADVLGWMLSIILPSSSVLMD